MEPLDPDAIRSRLRSPPGLLRRDRYLPFGVLVTLADFGSGPSFVLQRRAEGIRQGGEVSFPGGRIETGESAEAAAVRETCEELGIEAGRIEVFGQLGTLLAHWGAALDVFLGRLRAGDLAELQPNPREVARVFSAPVAFFLGTSPEIHHIRVELRAVDEDDGRVLLPAKELGLPERYHKSWGGRSYPTSFYRFEGEVIWGITADLITETLPLLS